MNLVSYCLHNAVFAKLAHMAEGKSINAGDVLHVIQIAVLVASLGMIYEKFQQTMDMVGTHGDKLDRIEHYLSSKDPQYWKRTEGH